MPYFFQGACTTPSHQLKRKIFFPRKLTSRLSLDGIWDLPFMFFEVETEHPNKHRVHPVTGGTGVRNVLCTVNILKGNWFLLHNTEQCYVYRKLVAENISSIWAERSQVIELVCWFPKYLSTKTLRFCHITIRTLTLLPIVDLFSVYKRPIEVRLGARNIL